MTLTCAQLVEQVTAYADGALDAHAERRFVQHASSCRGCATYVEQYRETLRLVRSMPADGVLTSPVPAGGRAPRARAEGS